jgi:hypothetical protein
MASDLRERSSASLARRDKAAPRKEQPIEEMNTTGKAGTLLPLPLQRRFPLDIPGKPPRAHWAPMHCGRFLGGTWSSPRRAYHCLRMCVCMCVFECV